MMTVGPETKAGVGTLLLRYFGIVQWGVMLIAGAFAAFYGAQIATVERFAKLETSAAVLATNIAELQKWRDKGDRFTQEDGFELKRQFERTLDLDRLSAQEETKSFKQQLLALSTELSQVRRQVDLLVARGEDSRRTQ